MLYDVLMIALLIAVLAVCAGVIYLLFRILEAVKNAKRPRMSIKARRKAAKEREKREVEQNRMQTLLENIEAYDGTGFGQKDID